MCTEILALVLDFLLKQAPAPDESASLCNSSPCVILPSDTAHVQILPRLFLGNQSLLGKRLQGVAIYQELSQFVRSLPIWFLFN